MSDIIPFSDTKEMARLMSKSVMLPKSLQDKPYDIFVILQMGLELGLKPMQALNGINVIQGKPTIAPQTMLALIYQRIPNAYVKFYKKGENYCCDMARSKTDEVYTAEWGEEKAKSMQLISKDNWKKQFENMCKWRCISEAARVVFPDVIQGFYTPEEMDENIEIAKELPRKAEVEDLTENKPKPDNTVYNATAELPKTENFVENHIEKEKLETQLQNIIIEKANGDKQMKKDIIDYIKYDFKKTDYTETELKKLIELAILS